MISWQQRALRIHATSLQLNRAKAIVLAPRKEFNTGFGSDVNGRNVTKKNVNPEFPAMPASYLQRVTAGILEAPSLDILGLAILKAPAKRHFQLIEQHGTVMNKNHLLLSLKKLTNLLETDYSSEELQATPAFQILVEIMLVRKTLFDAEECLEIFESICKFRLGADSSLGREILGILRLKLKDLTLHELKKFLLIINNVEGEGPHLDVMRLVIPIVFQDRYRNGIDLNNIDECHSSLIFILTYKMDSEISEAIVDAALEVAPLFTTSQAATVLHHAGDHASLARNSDSFRKIILHCVQIITGLPPELYAQALEQMIVNCDIHQTNAKSFFDALWKLAPSWSLPQVGHLLQVCYEDYCGYMTPETAEAVTQMLIEKRAQSDGLSAGSVFRFAQTIALCSRNHQPESDGMARCVQAANILIEADTCIRRLREKPVMFVKFLQALSYFGVFPDSLLQEAFSVTNKCDEQQLKAIARLLVHLERQAIIHGYPPYQIEPGVRNLAEEVKYAMKKYPSTGVMAAVLGDERFLYKNVETPLGTKAHYVVALKGKNQPILVPDPTNFFQAIPSGTKIIAIYLCKSGVNTFELTGMEKIHMSIWQRQLQAQNLCVMVVNENMLFPLGAADTAPQVAKMLEETYENGCEYRPISFLLPHKCQNLNKAAQTGKPIPSNRRRVPRRPSTSV